MHQWPKKKKNMVSKQIFPVEALIVIEYLVLKICSKPLDELLDDPRLEGM